jgi:outer membrane protein assembly factor BamB/tetratricopeptide (TPR) repeat protein
MKTEEFLNLLEKRELLPPRIAGKVREKLQQGNHRLTSEALLKYLVKKELIGRRTAKQLLETVLVVNPHAESSILGYMLPEEGPPPDGPDESEPPVLESVEQGPVLDFTIAEEEGLSIFPEEGPEETAEEEELSLLPEETAEEEELSLLPEEGVEEEELSLVPKEEPVDLSESTDQPVSGLAPISEGEPEDLFADAVSESSLPRKRKKRFGRGKRRRRKKNEWDSPLLLLGGGSLAALLVAGLFIGYLLNREDADQILEQAAGYFDGGSYTQSIAQYEKFVTHFPRHPQASAAKVHLGIARLWKATQGSTRYEQALQTARHVLEEIEEEPEFGLAQEDLASLLPAIATGLAEQAEQATDPDTTDRLVEQATSALSLCANTKYISKTYRDETALREVRATLSRVERRRRQDADLQQALQQIDQAIALDKTTEAYAIHKQLLKKHPGLLGNPQLTAKVLEISESELKVIRYVSEPMEASTAPRKSPVIASLALAERRGPAVPQAEGSLAVTVDGAIYGLRASDGGLLWRRYVGLQSQTAPVVLEGGDVLAIDSRYHELIRLEGATGKLRWRQSLGGPAARPVVAGGQILVAVASGQLLVVNPDSGERAGYVQFGQPLVVSPAMDRRGKRIYVAGEQASLYTLDANDFSCLGVFYLGHARGSLRVPPVALLNKVAVAVNSGAMTSQLRLLGTDPSGVVDAEVARVRMQGLVTTELLTAGRRLVALTSLGLVAVHETGSGEDSTALTLLARREAEMGDPAARYGLMQQDSSSSQWHVWVAGTKLNRMAILPTGGRLPVREIDQIYSADLFDHPLQVTSNLLIHVRRPEGQAGAIVAAMDSTTGETRWETDVAVPLAGPPVVDRRGPRITAATASGAVYQLDRAAMGRRVQDLAYRLPPFQAEKGQGQEDESLPLTESVSLGGGRIVFAAGQGARQLLLYQRDAQPNPLSLIPLESRAACPPVAWDSGVVVPTRMGQVFYFDAATWNGTRGNEAKGPDAPRGQSTYAPFQPALRAGVEHSWLSPATAGERLVLSDGREKVYLLQRIAEPQPHLEALTEVEVGPSALVTPLAVVGDVVVAGTEDGKLARFTLPSLQSRDPVALGAEVVWGPYAIGDRFLLVTAAGELVCVDSDGEIAWRQPVEPGGPSGRPLRVGEEGLLLWQNGSLSLLELSDGQQRGKWDLDQPVVAGPVAFGERFILSSHDGTLLVVNRPQAAEDQ